MYRNIKELPLGLAGIDETENPTAFLVCALDVALFNEQHPISTSGFKDLVVDVYRQVLGNELFQNEALIGQRLGLQHSTSSGRPYEVVLDFSQLQAIITECFRGNPPFELARILAQDIQAGIRGRLEHLGIAGEAFKLSASGSVLTRLSIGYVRAHYHRRALISVVRSEIYTQGDNNPGLMLSGIGLGEGPPNTGTFAGWLVDIRTDKSTNRFIFDGDLSEVLHLRGGREARVLLSSHPIENLDDYERIDILD